MSKCCSIVYWKHEDGWDAYRKQDCRKLNDGTWVPNWFDNPVIEDYPTKKSAIDEIKNEWHKYGMFCFVN